MKFKFTLLPPQRAPKALSAHKPIRTLGEHFKAFLNHNNNKSWPTEPEPEKVFPDWVYALWAVMVANNAKGAVPTVGKGVVPVKVKRTEPRPTPETWWDAVIEDCRDAALYGIYVEQPLCDAEYVSRRTRFLADDPEFIKETQLIQAAVRASAGAEIDKHLFGTRVHFSYRAAIKGLNA